MKMTGIMRRVDDLGRVSIPKEIRRKMKIREGDELDIYLSDDNHFVMFAKSNEDELVNLERAIEDLVGADGHSIATCEMKKELLSVVKKYKAYIECLEKSDGGSE